MTLPRFNQISLQGPDAEKFLQGQLTCSVKKLNSTYQATAIANLKGRVEFGIWIKKSDDSQYDIVISSDCLASLQAHIKKYGAFSKFTTSEPIDIYPYVIGKDNNVKEATFTQSSELADINTWMSTSIATGNFWIVATTQGIFQPQELRLHQRGGVDYDKGCYLGQEVIARIYFKASPKAFLHRIQAKGSVPSAGDSLGKIQIVNAIAMADNSGFEALVVARPEHIAESGIEQLTVLELPPALQGSVAREK